MLLSNAGQIEVRPSNEPSNGEREPTLLLSRSGPGRVGWLTISIIFLSSTAFLVTAIGYTFTDKPLRPTWLQCLGLAPLAALSGAFLYAAVRASVFEFRRNRNLTHTTYSRRSENPPLIELTCHFTAPIIKDASIRCCLIGPRYENKEDEPTKGSVDGSRILITVNLACVSDHSESATLDSLRNWTIFIYNKQLSKTFKVRDILTA